MAAGQAHIDFEVTDLDQAEKRADSLGAVLADSQPAPHQYLVRFDPAGHPFCLSTEFPAGSPSILIGASRRPGVLVIVRQPSVRAGWFGTFSSS
jgi:Glyoxalase-like domain